MCVGGSIYILSKINADMFHLREKKLNFLNFQYYEKLGNILYILIFFIHALYYDIFQTSVFFSFQIFVFNMITCSVNENLWRGRVSYNISLEFFLYIIIDTIYMQFYNSEMILN